MPEPNDDAPSAPFVHRYRFADVEYDEAAKALRVAGHEVSVEPLPLALLLVLLQRPDELITHAELLESVWRGQDIYPHVVASAVNKLRKALGKQGAAR
jgi:eukaryotic-like serine/threonine-protein kinase